MKVGSLCTGYGGLDMAVGGDLAWVCDFDKGAAKILAHRYPDVPNLHDLTVIDWSEVEPVDVLTAGFPCQPFSVAGKQKGTTDERHLWPYIADALRILRPRFAVFENVPGLLRLGLADVLADLAAIGFDAEWTTVRASDVGAPHRRERLFIVATRHTGHDAGSPEQWQQSHQPGETGGAAESDRDATPDGSGVGLEGGEPFGLGKSIGERAGDGGRTIIDTDSEGREGREPEGRRDLHSWGGYGPAVNRWERVLGRPAPNPTTTGRTGRPVLNPRFVEWMMGLPEGWVTDVPDLSRVAQLKALGNGVAPAQAAAALTELHARLPN
jgi:DNA (cytosine-5)-methyltransferase 1